MSRALAHIEKIVNLEPIENADRIELATILGWKVVVKKNEFKIGDKIVYFEIDSKLPEREEFEFMRDRKFKIKTIKLRGQISQGLAMPLNILPIDNYQEGQDVTNILGVKKIEDITLIKERVSRVDKFEKKYGKNKLLMFLIKNRFLRKIILGITMGRKKKNNFPNWVKKTDEVRIQNMPHILNSQLVFDVREKIDGTSATYTLRRKGRNKFEFIVCSRNIVQDTPDKKTFFDNDENVYWKIAKEYDIENVLKRIIKNDEKYITLQGEIIGEKIQGNIYGIKGHDFYAFNFITDKEGVIDSSHMESLLLPYRIKTVPSVYRGFTLPNTIEEMLDFATGKSLLADTYREGVVIRNNENNISFKVVSNEYLLKHNL